jgi:hypothetical protein
MTPDNSNTATDWTGLLADPDLSRNFGTLLQRYREAAPEHRERVLIEAVQDIKKGTNFSGTSSLRGTTAVAGTALGPAPASAVPPFQAELSPATAAADRRRHPRMKCFVAVELRVDDAVAPIWGNLSNTGMGGCQVETAAQVSGGSRVEIGLWVASGKIWVKGLALNGVVSRSAGQGVRVRFAGLEAASKESLRQFLKYVQESTQASKDGMSYLQRLK